MRTRLGIIGTGRIANRFAANGRQDLAVCLTAVYNPNLTSAKKYASEYHLPLGTDDWDAFLEQIDAAYVASPTATHGAYVRRLLERGKHVLCEKPMVLSKKEAEELFGLAKKQGLVLMEAIKTAYCPGFEALLEAVKEGRIGEIRDVEACFTKLVDPNLRELSDRNFGGSMTELGTYGCFAVLKLLGCDWKDIRFVAQRNEQGVDLFTKVFFEYEEPEESRCNIDRKTGRKRDSVRTALVKAGLGVKSEGELIISGTKGYLLAEAPWWLARSFEIRYEDSTKRERYEYPYAGNGLQYELGYFLDRVQRYPTKERVSIQESIALAGIMEQFLQEEAGYR